MSRIARRLVGRHGGHFVNFAVLTTLGVALGFAVVVELSYISANSYSTFRSASSYNHIVLASGNDSGMDDATTGSLRSAALQTSPRLGAGLYRGP